MDGFYDTMMASILWRQNEKVGNTKSPHFRGVAVICAVVYLLLYTGSMYEFCENARGKGHVLPGAVFIQ